MKLPLSQGPLLVLSRSHSVEKSFLKEIDSMTSISGVLYNVRNGQTSILKEQIEDSVDAIATIKKVLASSDLPFF